MTNRNVTTIKELEEMVNEIKNGKALGYDKFLHRNK